MFSIFSVGEVAEHLEYSHTAHFSAGFKRHFGHPPGQIVDR
jgi:AraC-like DNA-binding protein